MAIVKRPRIISIICIALVLGCLVSFFYLFAPSIKKLGGLIPAVLGLIITLQFVSVIGLWHMKRWGVQLFLISYFIRFITFYLLGILSTYQSVAAVFMTFYIIVFLVHYRKMDINL
ncbi:MAG: hypothetical protein JST26_12365 [Bacteroidetes bacterium]|nr:hypothetical protein [Bacteroidota bacterium]